MKENKSEFFNHCSGVIPTCCVCSVVCTLNGLLSHIWFDLSSQSKLKQTVVIPSCLARVHDLSPLSPPSGPVSPYCILFNDTVLKISFKKGGKRDSRRSLPPQTGCRERNPKATTICYLNAPVTDHRLSVARAKHTPACPAGSLCDEAQVSDCACVYVCVRVWVVECVCVMFWRASTQSLMWGVLQTWPVSKQPLSNDNVANKAGNWTSRL